MSKLLNQINLLFEEAIDDIEKLWTTFAKDKPVKEPEERSQEQLHPKSTYEIWFPAKTKEYLLKVRSRNPRSALLRLIASFPKIKYKGNIYTQADYINLFKTLVNNGDFSFSQVVKEEKYQISDIKSNRWGQRHVFLKKGKKVKRVLLNKFKGTFEVDIKTPGGKRVPRATITSLNEDTISDWNSYISKSPMLKSAIEVLHQLNSKGQAYIVGGAVRDIITGEKAPDDIDIATNVPMEVVSTMFDTYDLGKSKTFGVLGVKHNGFTFEVAQFRSDGAYLDGRRPEKVQVGVDFKTDVERRDFTINAMGIDAMGNIIDYFNGTSDIKNKVLKTVGDPHKRFGEDYLRMLRAARFASRMDYNIDPETQAAMKAHAEKIKQIAPERVLKEIIKMAEQSGVRFASALQILKDTGLLQHILPEVIEMEKYEHSKETHPEGNVLQHTLEALKQNKVKDPIVNLAILLHDVGKIKTFKKEGDKISYINHAEEGMTMIDEIANRLRMDNKTREAIKFATLNHMKFHEILNMSNHKIMQLVNHNDWDVLYNVAYADAAARKGIFDESEWNEITDKVEKLTREYKGKEAVNNIKKIVNGELVMQLRNLQTGPEVGKIISSTVEWILNNKIDLNDTEAIKNYILSVETK